MNLWYIKGSAVGPAGSTKTPSRASLCSRPPVYVEQPRQGVAPALSVEERLRRLQSVCGQGLLSATECEAKRQEFLRRM